MSKHMQLTVTVRPYYRGNLAGTHPRLARHLEHLDPVLAARDPSLYELAGDLDRLLYRVEKTGLGTVMLRHREALLSLRKHIEEHIADWNLAAADKLLYAVEDIFEEIESELDWSQI